MLLVAAGMSHSSLQARGGSPRVSPCMPGASDVTSDAGLDDTLCVRLPTSQGLLGYAAVWPPPLKSDDSPSAKAALADAKLRSSLRSREQFLLVNLFEEGCFNPGRDEVSFEQFKHFARTSETPRQWDEQTMQTAYEKSLSGSKQSFKSCGQFNNVLHMLMHALAVSRTLHRPPNKNCATTGYLRWPTHDGTNITLWVLTV
jgi:hypothetical protein